MAKIGRVLAVDYGDRRTGLAVCDALGISMRPLDLIRADSPRAAAAAIAAAARDEEADLVLLGLPINMDGTEGPRALLTREFGALLAPLVAPLPVEFYDERLTTKEAEAVRRDAWSKGARLDASKDSLAACVLLRGWLESR